MEAKCVFRRGMWLLHLIRSVRSQLRSDLKAGSKFIQTKTMDCVNCLCVPLCFGAWEKFKVTTPGQHRTKEMEDQAIFPSVGLAVLEVHLKYIMLTTHRLICTYNGGQ